MRRFGKNRNGSQRHRCDLCRRTFTDSATRPADGRFLPADKRVLALRMILEGNSVRSTERLTGVHRDTILAVLVETGERCEPFLSRTVHGLTVNDVQADEIWGFVACKEKTRERNGYGDEKGDAWCFVAIDRETKLVLTWHLGKREYSDAQTFSDKLRDATSGRFQLSTDGLGMYRPAVANAFGTGIDYAQLVKTYTSSNEVGTAARYSPGQVVHTHKVVLLGTPDEDRVCTSHIERQNLTMRMTLRRLTRLTNGHSKKWANHRAALALYFAYYNFCRVHATLKTTPAVAAGLTDHTWSVAELLVRIGE
jgi:IS1 family transposase